MYPQTSATISATISATSSASASATNHEPYVELSEDVRTRARGAAVEMLASSDSWMQGLGSRIQRIVAADDSSAAAAVRTYLGPADVVHLQASIKYHLWLRTAWSTSDVKGWVTKGLTTRYVSLLRDQEIVLDLLHEAA